MGRHNTLEELPQIINSIVTAIDWVFVTPLKS